ncbi:hypothetical protein BIW11_04285 [Tropilaelaps mercedesae]|uniref:E3 SUMO-protein ligase RanBP2-like n=1 Tax=Tropilaelaps mercedesae TaxID=418985 RepID=A0A1V9X8C6_9ACAR|nr:hypothetical protein BIW11_04285 [Tropilaelaps mercedesae]
MSRRRVEMDAQVKKALSNLNETEQVSRYLRIAQQYAAIQEFEEAKFYLQRYLKVKPESYEAFKVLGDVYLKQNKYMDAYEAHTSAYKIQASLEVLAAICISAAKISLDIEVRRDWLERAERAEVSAAEILALKESVLRHDGPYSQDLETVLNEQAALYPQDAESQVKLLSYYAEARRYKDCVQFIMQVEGSQEMRTSLRWYRECLAVLSRIHDEKALPQEVPLITLHLHVASRQAICLMADLQLVSDYLYDNNKSGSTNRTANATIGSEDFHKQLQGFDALLHEALINKTWYREGQWAFVLDHFTGQLLLTFALTMFRRICNEDSVRDEDNRKRGQALMFAALEKRPVKIDAEQWFVRVDENERKLLQELYLDGCYRTAICYNCLSNALSASSLPEEDFASRVRVAAAGDRAIDLITSRMFPGRAIKELYNQTVISRSCRPLPEKSQMAPFEANACVRMASSLEHLVWFLVSGVEIPTERIFRTLPVVPDMGLGGCNPAQSDIDAFLSAVHAAVRIFGAKVNIEEPTMPREVMQYAYTTAKQKKYWEVLYRRFVVKANSMKGLVQVKKMLNDGLEFVRGNEGRDSRATMPVWFMAQIARDQLKKARKKSAYYSIAVHYYKRILSQLDDHSLKSVPVLNSGTRSSLYAMFELPKSHSFDAAETSNLRNEARIEIGKFLLYTGELEEAIKTLAEVSHPRGYLYYARAARKLCQQLVTENDLEMAELIRERSRTLLIRGIPMAKKEPRLVEDLRRELDVLDMDSRNSSNNFANGNVTMDSNAVPNPAPVSFSALDLSALTPRVEPPAVPEFDFIRMELLVKEQCDKVVADSVQRGAKITFELAELKAMQTQLVESLAKVVAVQTSSESLLNALTHTTSELSVKVSQIGQQVTRVEEMAMLQHANQQDYHEYQDTSQQQHHQHQQQPQQSQDNQTVGISQSGSVSSYQSGALIIPSGVALPQFNLSSIKHPSLGGQVQPAATVTVSTTGANPCPGFSFPTFKAATTTPSVFTEQESAMLTPKILFESDGVIYERRAGQQNFVPLGGIHKIAVVDNQYPYRGNVRTLYYLDSKKILLEQILNEQVMARVYEADGQTNLTWTVNGTEYYARFADLSCLPQTLLRVFQSCGVTVVKAELPSALASHPQLDTKAYVAPSLTSVGSAVSSPLQAMASLANKTDWPPATTPTSSTTGLFYFSGSTPASKTLGSASVTSTSQTFSFGKSPIAASIAEPSDKTAPAIRSTAFTSTHTATSPSVAKEKTPEKGTRVKSTPLNPFAGFSFGTPKSSDEQKTTVLDGFSPAVTAASPRSNAELASSPVKSTGGFASPAATVSSASPSKSTFSFYSTTSPASPSTCAGIMASTSPRNDSRGETDHVDEYEPTANFQPVIDLPDLVEVKTGEESEEVIFCERAKLYRFASITKEWKERGLGDMKILRHKDTGRYRVVMRREQVLKLCANHLIIAGLKLQKRAKDTEFMWAAPDFAEGQLRNEQFVIRFKSVEQANEFKMAFETGVKVAEMLQKPFAADKGQKSETAIVADKIKTPPASGPTQSAFELKPQKAATTAPAGDDSLVDKFRPKPGSWDCSVCLVQNTSSATKCVACDALKVGTTAEPAPFAAPISTFKFGLSTTSWTSTSTSSSFSFGASRTTTGSATSPTTTVTFGFPIGGNSTTTSGFVFGQSSGTTSGSCALASSAPKISFALSTGADTEDKNADKHKGNSSLDGFTFGSPQKHEFCFEARHASEDEDEVAESKDVYFAPVIPLPPVVEVVTGEENQEVMYSHRAKLFRFVDKEWKERGIGDFKLLKDPASGKVRLTMRRNQVFKVCLNHYLTREITFTRRDDRSIGWSAIDFAEDEPEPTLFALRVKNKEVCDGLIETLTAIQSELTDMPNKPVPSPARPADTSSDSRPNEEGTATDPTPNDKTSSPKSGDFKLTLRRSLFKESSPLTDSDVTFVKEEKASPEEIAKARELMLPDNFFLYKTRCKKCKGCRGCESDASDEQETSVNVAPTQKPSAIFGSQSSFRLTSSDTDPKLPSGDALSSNSGFVFGSSNSTTFASLADNNKSIGFNFASGSNSLPWAADNQTSFFSSFAKKDSDDDAAASSGKTTTGYDGEAEGDADEEVPSDDVYFEPVVPMPELVDVLTGEEEDEVLYSQRAKLYVFHPDTSEWKERALGEVKILRREDGRARIVVRREVVHKVACNHNIMPNMELQPMATSNNAVTWSAIDFADHEAVPTTFALRIKDANRLEEFKRIFIEEVERARRTNTEVDREEAAPESAAAGDAVTSEDDKADTAGEDSVEDYDNLLYWADVTLAEEIPLGAPSWKLVGSGRCLLKVIYDDDIFAQVIVLTDKQTGSTVAETVIAIQTSLRQDGLQATWMARDTSRRPPMRRRFRATFNSHSEICNFANIFSEGKETAFQSGVVETDDPIPIRMGREQ